MIALIHAIGIVCILLTLLFTWVIYFSDIAWQFRAGIRTESKIAFVVKILSIIYLIWLPLHYLV